MNAMEKLTVIGKYTNLRCLKGIILLPVDYKTQNNAWTNAEIFILWFHHVLVHSVEEHFEKKGMSQNSRTVHLLGNYHVHTPDKELIDGIMEPFVDLQLWFQIKVSVFCVFSVLYIHL
jgi:hypothetical protein